MTELQSLDHILEYAKDITLISNHDAEAGWRWIYVQSGAKIKMYFLMYYYPITIKTKEMEESVWSLYTAHKWF